MGRARNCARHPAAGASARRDVLTDSVLPSPASPCTHIIAGRDDVGQVVLQNQQSLGRHVRPIQTEVVVVPLVDIRPPIHRPPPPSLPPSLPSSAARFAFSRTDPGGRTQPGAGGRSGMNRGHSLQLLVVGVGQFGRGLSGGDGTDRLCRFRRCRRKKKRLSGRRVALFLQSQPDLIAAWVIDQVQDARARVTATTSRSSRCALSATSSGPTPTGSV